jgi:hemerythrin-like domain-containing protein
MIREMLGIAEGILQDLHDDHNEVATLMERISDSESGAERTALFQEMSTKLLAHAQAEQEILYSRLETSSDEEARRFALEGTSEHGLIEQQVQKILGMGAPMSDGWAAELKVLEDLVEHHVDEEEGAGFGCAREEFETEELEAMAEEFQRRKEGLMLSARD